MRPVSRRPAIANTAAAVILTAGLALVFFIIFQRLSAHWNWAQTWKYRDLLLRGWWGTLWISLATLAGSTLVGVLLMLLQRTGLPAVRLFCRAFIELVRGTPLLVVILVGYYVLFSQVLASEGRPYIENRQFVGILLLSVFSGAYLGEILRGGIESIPRTQIEAARAVGFDRRQVYRHVIFPQALRRIMPALAGQFVSLVKDSSLLSVIGISELAQANQQFVSATYGGLEACVPLAIGYLIITLPLAWLSHRLEQRYKYET